ncbi:MAG: type II toxin-antitoxin system HicA family toxin [Candidatus Acidiferrum sp.]
MTRLPRLKGKEVVRALQRAGFRIDRTRGSHVFMEHVDGRVTTVPVHGGETLGPGLMRSILRDVDMTPEKFAEFV